ncbi:PadR family transcriptional regulator [Microbispora sp. NPDC049125]|uniref:PadR family transcriptional regulator n=1 Tax=Microbispora sp. NPDC049125 TaxID=3154929 RepID=UPI00346559CB
MTVRRRSNPLALAVIGLLYERPMHPYEMAATLRERRKEESIKLNYGSLYSVVQSLEKQGLIVTQETRKDGRRPERTVYGLTERGRVELLDWLSELVSIPAREFTQFEAALSLMPYLGPDQALRMLLERARRLETELVGSQAVLEQAGEVKLPRLMVVEYEYRLALRRTELGFVNALIRDIADGSLEGIDAWRRLHDSLEAGTRPDIEGEVRSWNAGRPS